MSRIKLGWVDQTLTRIAPESNGLAHISPWLDLAGLDRFPPLVNVIVFVSFRVFVPFIDICWI